MNQSVKPESVLFHNDTEQDVPSIILFNSWVESVIEHQGVFFQVSIEILDLLTSQKLNNDYRHINKPTNILSFPLELPEFVKEDLIGDLAICADVVIKEAKEQNKSVDNHWAHLTIHGCLHLLGYDHIDTDDAEIMESIEIMLLKNINIQNPYN